MAIEVKVYTTDDGVKFLRLLPFHEITKVKSWRKGGPGTLPETVEVIFKNGLIVNITEAFATGYRGTGPSGLYDILVEMGVSPQDAEKVFTSETVKTWKVNC